MAISRGKEAATAAAPEATSPDQSGDSSALLLERAQGGDRSSINELIGRAVPALRQWARGRLSPALRHDADTEDVVQDAVLRMLKGIERFQHRTVGGLHAYLRKSVINRIRDLVRSSRRRGLAETIGEELPDLRPTPLESSIMREDLDRFLGALEQLKPSDRQVVVWRLELGYDVDEIATRLGKSKAAAGMTVTRAISRLTKVLSEH